jgi:hemerythrin
MYANPDFLSCERHLPARLRTGHWFNDIQHGMFIILFGHATRGIADGSRKIVEAMIDNISMYLYLHFLSEEEGMAFSLAHGHHDRDTVARHVEIHLKFIEGWRQRVLVPFKNGELAGERLLKAVEGFRDAILEHIANVDQHVYGRNSAQEEHHHRAEIAQLAGSGIPLSPYMAGAFEMLRHLAPDVAKSLKGRNIAKLALEPLGLLDLTPGAGRLLDGVAGSLRDRVFAQFAGGLPPRRNEAPALVFRAAA